MAEIRFEWDPRKAEANKRKHGISFELATQVFADAFMNSSSKDTIMEKSAGVLSVRSVERSSSSPTQPAKKRTLKSSASSRRDARSRKKVVVTKGIPKMTAEMRRELAALEAMPDDQIDFSDIPEITEEEWRTKTIYVGLMYRPGKKSVTIRLDEDTVKWFKKQGKGWQTKMNWVLRLYFASHRKTGVKVGRP